MTILPPLPSVSFKALIVTLSGESRDICLSVRAVIRNFSSASLAFEMSSRKKISLDGIISWKLFETKRDVNAPFGIEAR